MLLHTLTFLFSFLALVLTVSLYCVIIVSVSYYIIITTKSDIRILRNVITTVFLHIHCRCVRMFVCTFYTSFFPPFTFFLPYLPLLFLLLYTPLFPYYCMHFLHFLFSYLYILTSLPPLLFFVIHTPSLHAHMHKKKDI